MHAHFGTEALMAWPLAKALNIPLIVTLHGFDINVKKEWWQGGGGGLWMRSYPKRLIGLAANKNVHFIAVSKAIMKRAIDYGIPEAKIRLSYIGVDTETFTPHPRPFSERFEVLFVGRLVEKKGCRYLLEAFASIQDRFPDFELAIVGSGPLEIELKEYARRKKIRVQFLGALNSDQIRERLGSARVFCLPSITAVNGDAEGLPISLLEAQSSGIPVVTSAGGGTEEGIIPGKTGFAIPEKDIDGLAGALSRLLNDHELASQFGEEGKNFAIEKMDLKFCTAKLESIYEEIIFPFSVGQ